MQIEVSWAVISSLAVTLFGGVFWLLRRWIVDKVDRINKHDEEIATLKEEKAVLKATQDALLNELKGLRKEIHALNQNILTLALGEERAARRNAQG